MNEDLTYEKGDFMLIHLVHVTLILCSVGQQLKIHMLLLFSYEMLIVALGASSADKFGSLYFPSCKIAFIRL